MCKLSILSSDFLCENIHTSGQQLTFEYIKLLTKTSFSFKPKNDLSRISAFNWFPVDLQVLDALRDLVAFLQFKKREKHS